MWSRISLRMKITVLTLLALTLVTACITWLSNHNARRNFLIPLENFARELYGAEFHVTDIEMQAEGFTPAMLMLDGRMEMQLVVTESHRTFQDYSIVVAVVFVLIGAIMAYIISGQTLKPIKSLAKKVEDIDVNNLDTPIESSKSNDEVSRLTYSFNSMLGKLNRSFEIQKLFAQNAAHELKTPLASIMTNIEVLQLDDEPTTEEYKEVVDTVKASTEQLIKLVHGLLSINSIIDESAWQSFSGSTAFAEIIDSLENEIAQKGLDVLVSGDCRIKGERTLLERAFSNLVHNAVRYNIDSGTVKIILSDKSIIIEDSGVGIPAEDLAHIFEPFYVVDKSRTKSLGGHGLGMSIAKNIFDSHSMDINISSEVEQGTKIIVNVARGD